MAAGENAGPHRVVIVGGGFGGLYAAKSLAGAPVSVTVIDKRNFHLFQPLLYQVATGSLSAGDIASALRAIFSGQRNLRVLLAEMVNIRPTERRIVLADGELPYDTLIIATGVQPRYFGHDDWAQETLPLKTVEDATHMRRRILLAFETAERESDPAARRVWMTFVVIGAGSAGVELSGALAELAHATLKDDFETIDPAASRIILLEASDRVLPAYPAQLSARAERSLARLGVDVRTGARVADITDHAITVERGGSVEEVQARTILWTAGIQATPVAQVLSKHLGAGLDRLQRVVVGPDLTVPGHPDIFVIGDLAHCAQGDNAPLPALAPVAIQQGQYVGRAIGARRAGRAAAPFRYRDKGNLAVIGRNQAVAQVWNLRFGGFVAWLLWAFVHILYLIGFENKALVMTRWMWDYWSRRRGARLITGD